VTDVNCLATHHSHPPTAATNMLYMAGHTRWHHCTKCVLYLSVSYYRRDSVSSISLRRHHSHRSIISFILIIIVVNHTHFVIAIAIFIKRRRYSDPDLSFTALAARTDVCKYSFFPRTIRDWNSLDTLSRSRLIPQPPVDISCC